MSQEKPTLEVIAPTVEEAVASGLSQLGLKREDVEIDVLDQGSRGLFGFGGRQARVRLVILGAKEFVEESQSHNQAETPTDEKAPDQPEPELAASVQEDDETLKVAREVVSELLEKMKVNATLKTSYIEGSDAKDKETVLVDIQGNDLSILIGRRSETLYALQYIAGLIISKELDRLVPLVIDVQGYRSRRERQLRQLARRMAEQVLHTGKRQALEPMPANERRIIHIELRDHPKVTTESVGEEPNRKVTIVPKK